MSDEKNGAENKVPINEDFADVTEEIDKDSAIVSWPVCSVVERIEEN